MKKKVSLIIPVYNGEQYLERCINSAIKQTYKNIEIICINDGSTDRSVEILKKYDKSLIIIDSKNQGVSATRNKGMEIATGEYMAFLDCDDYLDEKCIENLVELMEKQKSDIVITSIKKVSEAENKIIEKFNYKNENITLRELAQNFFEYDKNSGLKVVWNKLYKKDLIKDIYFDKEYKIGEDFIFNLQVLERCERITFIEDSYYNYIVNPNSVTNKTKMSYNEFYEIEKIINYRKKLEQLYMRIGVTEEQIHKFYLEQDYRTFTKTILNILSENSPYKNFKEKKNAIKKNLNYDQFKETIIENSTNNKYKKIIRMLLKINNVTIILVIFSLINKMRR